MIGEPLGLPKGSVRAILAIGLTTAIIVAAFKNPVAAELLHPIATLILGYYVGSRADFNRRNNNG